MSAPDLYKSGQLAEAVAAATATVKSRPTDVNARGFLAELLCVAGEWERADMQLDALLNQDPGALLGVSQWRQLIRAEQARQQFFSDGRVPEFLEPPTPALKKHLEASICLREGNEAEAQSLLEQANELRPSRPGHVGDFAFADFRDLDDLTSSFLEVLTSNGKYYWIPLERIEEIEFRPAARPRDLLWRQTHLVIPDGPDGEVYLPTLYPTPSTDPRGRLGRFTDWQGGDGSPVRGVGLRTYLVGEETRTILELETVEFQSAT